METTNSLIAEKLAAIAAKAKGDTAKTSTGLERDISDMQQSLIPSSISRRALRMLPGGKFFVPPAQRQMWGDEQVLPHVNWGDLFFDLFYVSALYNLSYIYKIEVHPKNIWYFFGCFLPIMTNWMDKTHYTAQFEAPNDTFHRVIEVLELCALGLTVLDIKSEDQMDNTGCQEMFLFSLGLVMCNFFVTVRYFEIGFVWVEGGPEAKIFARLMAFMKLVPLGFFIAAAVVTVTLRDNGTKSSAVPIILCIAGWVAQGATYFSIFGFAYSDESHRGWIVPMNIPYLIHRYGEWTNLVLGESILALLTAGTSVGEKYVGDLSFFATFFFALVTVILFQYLHFQSQPHHAEDHALNDVHGFRASSFLLLTQLYSAALILVGTCFKIFMYSFSKEDKKYGDDVGNGDKYGAAPPIHLSMLHDEDHDEGEKYDVYLAKKHISQLYCFSLASAMVLCHLIILTHKRETLSTQDETSAVKSLLRHIFITVPHIVVVLCVALAWKLVTKPSLLVGIGLLGVFLEVILRSLERVLLHPGDQAGAHRRVSAIHIQQFERNPAATAFKATTSNMMKALSVLTALREAATDDMEA